MTQGYFYAHTAERPPHPDASPLTLHTTFKKAQAVARKRSKRSKTAITLVMERDFETGLSSVRERWEKGVGIQVDEGLEARELILEIEKKLLGEPSPHFRFVMLYPEYTIEFASDGFQWGLWVAHRSFWEDAWSERLHKADFPIKVQFLKDSGQFVRDCLSGQRNFLGMDSAVAFSTGREALKLFNKEES
jgi:hypothetical protein